MIHPQQTLYTRGAIAILDCPEESTIRLTSRLDSWHATDHIEVEDRYRRQLDLQYGSLYLHDRTGVSVLNKCSIATCLVRHAIVRGGMA
jgi:hypothetical protein